ncbi:hypothetical protein SO802_031196 [Lithocarpus litseifolius]|uniref:Uncharacterized protein n=1 Tax=Lithocarpus litseifolius TaxID=425828 RepID=A0AAW2BN24_9ROSI
MQRKIGGNQRQPTSQQQSNFTQPTTGEGTSESASASVGVGASANASAYENQPLQPIIPPWSTASAQAHLYFPYCLYNLIFLNANKFG